MPAVDLSLIRKLSTYTIYTIRDALNTARQGTNEATKKGGWSEAERSGHATEGGGGVRVMSSRKKEEKK